MVNLQCIVLMPHSLLLWSIIRRSTEIRKEKIVFCVPMFRFKNMPFFLPVSTEHAVLRELSDTLGLHNNDDLCGLSVCANCKRLFKTRQDPKRWLRRQTTHCCSECYH